MDSDRKALLENLSSMADIEQKLAASETCSNENGAYLRSKYEWIANFCVPMHRAKLRIIEIETSLARQVLLSSAQVRVGPDCGSRTSSPG